MNIKTNPQTLVVIMPAYNSEATIGKAIESILSQSYRNLRLVVVDDCSTDSTLAIAKSYLRDDRVAIYKNNKNSGAYYARNVGLAAVKDVSWYAFTTHDADDVSFEHRYVRSIKFLKKPRFVAVQDTFRRIDLKTKKNLGESLTMAHAVFAREVFEKIGYFEVVRFGADWEYWLRMNAYSKHERMRSISIQEVVGESYVHKDNLTVQIPIGSALRRKYIKDSYANMIPMNSNFNWYRDFNIDNSITELIA